MLVTQVMLEAFAPNAMSWCFTSSDDVEQSSTTRILISPTATLPSAKVYLPYYSYTNKLVI
ncbi:hypothetical protein IFVP177_C250034 [Vibrio parahaemolyticus]